MQSVKANDTALPSFSAEAAGILATKLSTADLLHTTLSALNVTMIPRPALQKYTSGQTATEDISSTKASYQFESKVAALCFECDLTLKEAQHESPHFFIMLYHLLPIMILLLLQCDHCYILLLTSLQ